MPQNVYEEFRWVEEEKHIQVEKKKYYEMDVLSLMQHEHRNHGFSVVATNNSNIPACYEYQVTAT